MLVQSSSRSGLSVSFSQMSPVFASSVSAKGFSFLGLTTFASKSRALGIDFDVISQRASVFLVSRWSCVIASARSLSLTLSLTLSLSLSLFPLSFLSLSSFSHPFFKRKRSTDLFPTKFTFDSLRLPPSRHQELRYSKSIRRCVGVDKTTNVRKDLSEHHSRKSLCQTS